MPFWNECLVSSGPLCLLAELFQRVDSGSACLVRGVVEMVWQPLLRGFYQATHVPALVMPSCESGATSPSSQITCKTKKTKKTSIPRRCQDKEEEEGTVRTNKNKGKPVSSWRCQRQAGTMKALQRVVWSLIFLMFGVHMAKAEEQKERKIPLCKFPSRIRWKRIHSCENCEWKWDERPFCF